MSRQIKVTLVDWMGSDRAIAEAAWVSSGRGNNRSDDDVKRVVEMMASEGHGTPFESVIFRFHIRLPVAIDRQHMTHRIATHNGMSARYRSIPTEWYDLPSDVVNIINRLTEENQPLAGEKLRQEYDEIFWKAFSLYNKIILRCKSAKRLGKITDAEFKRVREVMRFIIPVGSMTERLTIMNLRSFANYQKLRNTNHAQPEIREIAKQMLAIVQEKNICPIAISALMRKGWNI